MYDWPALFIENSATIMRGSGPLCLFIQERAHRVAIMLHKVVLYSYFDEYIGKATIDRLISVR
jgi:hypothetical protein